MAQTAAYQAAKAGGRHSVFYQVYIRCSSQEIRRGIRSLARRIQEHEEKIRTTGQSIAGFAQLDPRQQRALIEHKWPADIKRLQEQQDILEGILWERTL